MCHERPTLETQRHVRVSKDHRVVFGAAKRQRVGRRGKRTRSFVKSGQFHTELHERQPQTAAAKEIWGKTDKYKLGIDREKLLAASVAFAQKQGKTEAPSRIAG